MYTEAKSLAYFISQMNLKKKDDVILLSFKEKMEKMEEKKWWYLSEFSVKYR